MSNPLYVAFDGRQVAVHSNLPEIRAEVERIFERLLDPEAGNIVARLEVRQEGGKYRLQESGEVAEQESLEAMVHALDHGVVLHLIKARSDLLWLHASAAAWQGKGVLIAGAAGRGKSTLVTQLCARGWTYLSDDVVPLDPRSNQAKPFPRAPMVRVNDGEEFPGDRVYEIAKTAVLLQAEAVCRTPVPIVALVFPAYDGRSATRIAPCPPAAAALEMLQNCLNFPIHREIAVRYLCDMVKRLPAFQLSFNQGDVAAALIAQAVEEGLASL
jgi:hypothetical protein